LLLLRSRNGGDRSDPGTPLALRTTSRLDGHSAGMNGAISQDDLFSGPMSAPPGHMGVPFPTILNKSKGSAANVRWGALLLLRSRNGGDRSDPGTPHDITAASPVSDVLVTPPPIRSAEPYTPAKSLNSSLSFETFGRHGHGEWHRRFPLSDRDA
jgi:hypothetical protein